MTNNVNLTVAQRIEQLMNHLGIERAHFAGRMPPDWIGSAIDYPERILSLTLACPVVIEQRAVNSIASKLLVFNGDHGHHASRVDNILASTPNVRLTTLPDYSNAPWNDVAADHSDEFKNVFLSFLAEMGEPKANTIEPTVDTEGVIAGISYSIHGTGPALILLPLALAPTQWAPLVQELSEQYCTIVLGGAHLGIVALLEERGKSAGWINMFRSLIANADLKSGHSVLDVGTGTGALCRSLAHDTNRENPITGIDINGYLLREAARLADDEGLSEILSFEPGSAEKLPFPDNSFDLTFSATVIEEVDANQMLAEMVRVTKPGGKVAIIARARDIPFVANLPLRAEVKDKAENSPYGGVAPQGCADASLYEHFRKAGLKQIKKFPYLTAFELNHPIYLNFIQRNFMFAALDQAEKAEWQAARDVAGETYFISAPHHCAVGTKIS